MPLRWSDLIQETLSEHSAGNSSGNGGGGACTKVLNRHQRLDMPFSQRMNILRLPFSVTSATHETYAPFSTNKLSISKGFPVKMKDMPHTHLQALWFLFACQTYRVELIDMCCLN